MNREILFRGKRADNNKWVYGYLIKGATRYVIQKSIAQYPQYDVMPETIGQYTGVKDEHGEKIFEGDIIRCGDDMFEIVWDEVGFKLLDDNCLINQLDDIADISEIVCNIYDKK